MLQSLRPMMGAQHYDDLWKRPPHKWSSQIHLCFMSREQERENGEELGLWKKGFRVNKVCGVKVHSLGGELGLSIRGVE